MFRYKDQHGRTQPLADESELKSAIADGRIHGGTPFAEGEERWTTASLHAAYQRNRSTASKPAPTSVSAPVSRWQRYALGALPVLVVVAATYGKVEKRLDERDRLVAAIIALNEGEAVPAALLDGPPRGRAARQLWVFMAAAHDTREVFVGAQRRLGVDDIPAEFLQPSYLRRASAYPHVGRYFENLQQFYNTYRDSLNLITERSIRARAAQAKLSERDIRVLVDNSRDAAYHFMETAHRGSQLGVQGRRVHDILIAAESQGIQVRGNEVQFQQAISQRMFNGAIQRMERLEAEMDSMQQIIAANAKADIEKAIGRR